jgi:GT2 family glycosyltransferase
MDSPFLTVLIPTHGRPGLLERTLASLAECALPDSYRELVVIENGSRAGAEELVVNLPPQLNARLMHEERANKSYALNRALETIDDGLVVFFDDDIRVAPDALLAYARAAEVSTEEVYFGGPWDVEYEIPPDDWIAPLLPPSTRPSKGPEEFAWFIGYNWAAYASDLRDLGGFNPDYGPGSPLGATGQETEMQRRMRRAGLKAHPVPEASVTHYVPERMTTPQWIVGRKFRDGVRRGIDWTRGLTGENTPIEMVREALVCALSVVKQVLRRDRFRAWRAAHTMAFHTGRLYGALWHKQSHD